MTDKLTARQNKALVSLLEGNTIRQAADLAHVSERQLYRWLDQDAFSHQLKALQCARVDQVNNRLLALCVKALDTLEDTLKEPGAYGQSVARQAAVNVLDQAHKWRDLTELEERLTSLEERVGL